MCNFVASGSICRSVGCSFLQLTRPRTFVFLRESSASHVLPRLFTPDTELTRPRWPL